MKSINEEEDRKAKGLAQSLSALNDAAAKHAQEVCDYNARNKGGAKECHEKPFEVKPNSLQGTTNIVIPPRRSCERREIGVIGLPKTGRSTLIGALAGGVWPHHLSTNPVPSTNPTTSQKSNIYKLNYPNNGFVDGGIDGNQPIYDDFFRKSQLKNLHALLVTIDGTLREEDYLVITLALNYRIPIAIVRTKLDEWLDNRPKTQSRDAYLQNDKEFIHKSLRDLGVDFSKSQIYNVSALAMITVTADGAESEMIKYKQDEELLMRFLETPDGSAVETPKPSIQCNVLLLGLKGAGKSALKDSLHRCFTSNNMAMEEQTYDETMSTSNVIQYEFVKFQKNPNDYFRKLQYITAKIYLIVVPHTVGRIDVELVKHFIDRKQNFAVLLSRTDEQIDNLKRNKSFIRNQDYIKQS